MTEGDANGLVPVELERIDLVRVRLPLVRPFVSAHGTEDVRDILLVRATARDGVEGWGECAAPLEPRYTPEYVDGATRVVQRFLAPALLAGGPLGPEDVAPRLRSISGHPMAKAALEMAVLDVALRRAGRPLAAYLGATRAAVPAGVAAGLHDDIDGLLTEVGGYVDQGYTRVKLKVEPGRDVALVAAVRETFGDIALQVDANESYAAAPTQVGALDRFGLLLIEQPLAADDLLGHAELAAHLTTPVCLDESVTSVGVAATALRLGACRAITIKPGRLGGLLAARTLHDLCVREGADAWVGGMLESGIGRAANLALAALPGFTLTGDLSASDRYWAEDLTEPFVLEDGMVRVPHDPGLGVAPRPDALASAEWLAPET